MANEIEAEAVLENCHVLIKQIIADLSQIVRRESARDRGIAQPSWRQAGCAWALDFATANAAPS
jgi:hypothetical protein